MPDRNQTQPSDWGKKPTPEERDSFDLMVIALANGRGGEYIRLSELGRDEVVERVFQEASYLLLIRRKHLDGLDEDGNMI